MKRNELLEITKGNVYAADFCEAYIARVHFIDDAVDEEKRKTDVEFVRSEQDFMEHFIFNPWAKEFQTVLWPLMVVGMNAWLDSNEWEKARNKKLNTDAEVLKGVYHELIWFVAYLCGGREHMREMSRKYREFDHEERN